MISHLGGQEKQWAWAHGGMAKSNASSGFEYVEAVRFLDEAKRTKLQSFVTAHVRIHAGTREKI